MLCLQESESVVPQCYYLFSPPKQRIDINIWMDQTLQTLFANHLLHRCSTFTIDWSRLIRSTAQNGYPLPPQSKSKRTTAHSNSKEEEIFWGGGRKRPYKFADDALEYEDRNGEAEDNSEAAARPAEVQFEILAPAFHSSIQRFLQ